jgi:DNA-binding response OmpR family regulator
MDAELPVLSVTELCTILRNRPETASLPVVVLDFNGMNEARESAAFASGADDYFDGYAEPSSVLSRIRTVLLRRHFATTVPRVSSVLPRQYVGRHLMVNFDDVFVSVDGRPVRLPRTGFQLLRYLVEHKNKVVTREELLHSVWCEAGPVRTQVVDVQVYRLRRKLASAGAQIETYKCIGYRFID